ncbi:MAG: hypothetical protein LBC11_03305, partial [Puniceicoccales bacterium]|nr:hypothetical protein [Puniceicoccales bacterium]
IDETWKKFEEAIKNSEEDPEGNYINEETKPAQQAAIETLRQWISGGETGKMSLEDISENFQALDGLMSKAGECIPELFEACASNPESEPVAKLLFPAHLYHTRVLVHPRDVEIEDTSRPFQAFAKTLVEAAEKRSEFKELKFAIFPDEFVLHPDHADELYFEAQMDDASTCGIHALNHFTGKPIFSSKKTEEAHTLCKCSVEAQDLISKLERIRENLESMKSQLQNNRMDNLEPYDIEGLNQAANSINQKLTGIDRIIAAIKTMQSEGENLLENNPLQRHANSIRDIIRDIKKDLAPNKLRYGFLTYSSKLKEQARSQFGSYTESIADVSSELTESLFSFDGVDPVVLRVALEEQAGIVLHTESGAGREITDGPQVDASQEKRELLEALKRDELPNNIDRAIVGDGSHFRCVRKLSDGQWVLLDSAQKEGPIVLPKGGLARLLGEYSNYQIMYCQSEADQQKLENFVANAQ